MEHLGIIGLTIADREEFRDVMGPVDIGSFQKLATYDARLLSVARALGLPVRPL